MYRILCVWEPADGIKRGLAPYLWPTTGLIACLIWLMICSHPSLSEAAYVYRVYLPEQGTVTNTAPLCFPTHFGSLLHPYD